MSTHTWVPPTWAGPGPPGVPFKMGTFGEVLVSHAPHHWGCLKCRITVTAPTQAAAREGAIQHGMNVHNVSIEPALTDAICPACLISDIAGQS